MRYAIVYFIVGLLLGACQPKVTYRYLEGKVYGTYYHVSYLSAEDWQDSIRQEMDRVNVSLSMFNPESTIARINRNETDRVDKLFEEMFVKAMDVHRATEGAFDITVAPLVNAWGFGFKHEQFPDSARIDTLRELVGMDKLTWQSGRLLKQNPGMQLDASSIAKGLGVDLVAELLDRKNVSNYMVEIGGEVRVKGKSSKGRSWRIGIDRPEDDPAVLNRELQMVLGLTDGALATSGNYRNFYVHEGKKYAHTIHPGTGYPVQTEILSASVYAPTCMEADAYATAFMVLGLKKAVEIVDTHPELEACFIYQEEGKLKNRMSPGWEKMIVSVAESE